MDATISKVILSKIKEEAKTLTDNEQMQQILIEFAYSQVVHAQRALIDSSRRLISFEYQVMMILENFVLKEYGVDSIRGKTKKVEYILPKHTFCYLSDYFLNCLYPKSKFAKQLKKNNLTKSSNTRKVANFLQLKQHSTILNAVIQIQNRIDTDKRFRENMVLMKYKSETLLNSWYILD